MTDPLRDDRFPDRPQHPDFWRLSSAVTQHDGKTDEGGEDVQSVIAELIDPESLIYMAQQRTGIYLQRMNLPPSMAPLLMGAVVDGVMTGIRFQMDGGKRDA